MMERQNAEYMQEGVDGLRAPIIESGPRCVYEPRCSEKASLWRLPKKVSAEGVSTA